MITLDFHPFFGLASKHLQMIISAFIPGGKAPLSIQKLIDLGNGDQLSCEISTPLNWKNNDKTIVLIHGLGGSHASNYMTRIARKLHDIGKKVVRVNLRGCGSGKGLSKQPYSGGTSDDVLKVLIALKNETPHSDLVVAGFSLGGNIALKLAGELGSSAENLVKTFFAICPPFDLEETVLIIGQKRNYLYHQYYLKKILKQAVPWTTEMIATIYDFDDKITAPLWGFTGAKNYYQSCSSKNFLRKIHVPTYIICAKDDPFVSLEILKNIIISDYVRICITKHGSHMGFIGQTNEKWKLHWIDQQLLNWIETL